LLGPLHDLEDVRDLDIQERETADHRRGVHFDRTPPGHHCAAMAPLWTVRREKVFGHVVECRGLSRLRRGDSLATNPLSLLNRIYAGLDELGGGAGGLADPV
jgi:hypothetical protein